VHRHTDVLLGGQPALVRLLIYNTCMYPIQ
jgi:hypothetical protein